jgi:hypothetical protein
LFEAFLTTSRKLSLGDAVESKPQIIEVKTAKSTFAALLDSDDEEEGNIAKRTMERKKKKCRYCQHRL